MLCRFVVLIAATLSFAAAADIKVVEQIVAKVNGEIVTMSDLDQLRVETENELKEKGAPPAQAAQILERTMQDALRDKIDALLLVQRGKDLNISVDADALKEIGRMQVQSRISDPDKFSSWIHDQFGVSLEEYRLYVRILKEYMGA